MTFRTPLTWMLSLVLLGCTESGTEVTYLTMPVVGDNSAIADPRARWQAYGLTSYAIEQQHSCFCVYGGETCIVYVRKNAVVDVVKKSDGKSILAEMPRRFKTVDELFALAGSISPDSVASLVIEYDPRFGYPSFISVDYRAEVADDEFAYHSQNIALLLK